jgi:hypothetical protein
MRGDMNHSTWIAEQFKKKTKACYRNVLIHTSFVETVVKEEALSKLSKKKRKKKPRKMGFECAIKVLRRNGYDRNMVDQIDKLRDKRNKIIHALLKDMNLNERLINMTIREMRALLKHIYHNSAFIQGYFQNGYQIDTTRF